MKNSLKLFLHINKIYNTFAAVNIWQRIKNSIGTWFRKQETTVLSEYGGIAGGYCLEERLPFSRVLFLNICDILTDLLNEVVFLYLRGDKALFYGFKAFFDVWGKFVANLLFRRGYVVIGLRGTTFAVMKPNEYYCVSDTDATRVKAYDADTTVYVMRSVTYMLTGMSDEKLLYPYLKYADNVMNGSNTVSSRLGSMIIMSPANPPQSPTVTTLSKESKQEMEEEFGKQYGALDKQKQMLLLQRPMNAQVVNMAGLDQRTYEKLKIAILAICDRIKVPANQVAIIDASNSRSLSNGTELREGDLAKYRSLRRLLNATFWQMAEDFGLSVDYYIENEPRTTQGDSIER